MPGSFGNDRELSVARSVPSEPGELLALLCDRPELLDRDLRFLTHDLRPPGLDPIPALGIDEQGRLSILEWCGEGEDEAALRVLDHLEWLAENLSFLRSLGIATQIRDLSREWRVFVVLSRTAPLLTRRLQWVSEVSFEYFVVRRIQVEGGSSLLIEPWNAWRFHEEKNTLATVGKNRPGPEIVEEQSLEELSHDALLSPREREAILTFRSPPRKA